MILHLIFCNNKNILIVHDDFLSGKIRRVLFCLGWKYNQLKHLV